MIIGCWYVNIEFWSHPFINCWLTQLSTQLSGKCMQSSEWLRKHSEWLSNRWHRMRNLANNIGVRVGGLEQNRPWVLGTERCSEVRKRGTISLNQTVIDIHIFRPTVT